MPAPDRLAELRRQRALLQEHLAWLEREIAAAEQAGGANVPAPGAGNAATTPSGVSAVPVRDQPAAESSTAWSGEDLKSAADPSSADAEAIIDRYRAPSGQLEKNVRQGCLLYFTAALLILGGVITVLWFAFRR